MGEFEKAMIAFMVVLIAAGNGFILYQAVKHRVVMTLLVSIVCFALLAFGFYVIANGDNAAGEIIGGLLLGFATAPIAILIGIYIVSWWNKQIDQPFSERMVLVEQTIMIATGGATPAPEVGEPQPESEPTPEPEPPDLNEIILPEKVRTQHTLIAAQSGHGKSQLLQSLILDDLEKDATIIVMDSQRQLIANLLHVVPANRLVHLTPTDPEYPLALNLFEPGQDPSLFEYIFSALDAQMTSKQAMVYRYLSRLVCAIPGGNIETMRQLLERDGLAPYRQYVIKLPPIAQAFFTTEYPTRQYNETREQIARRLYTLLENDTFLRMFSAPKMRLNLAKEMNDRKVILIDTAKRTLTGDAFKVFGRFFIAQIAKAIFTRQHPYRHRVYIYIDEFQEYGGEEDFIAELFTQARKFNVALTVAFQYIDQLPEAVRKAILANTATKLVGKVSAPDRRILAAEMSRDPFILQHLKKGEFVSSQATWCDYTVPFGRLEDFGTRSKTELTAIREDMRRRYAVEYKPTDPPEPPKDPFAGFEERS